MPDQSHRLGWPPLALLLNDSPPTSKAKKVEVKRREEFVAFETGDHALIFNCMCPKCEAYFGNGAAQETDRPSGEASTAQARRSPVAAPPSKPATQAGEWKDVSLDVPNLKRHEFELRNIITGKVFPGHCDLRSAAIHEWSKEYQFRLLTPAQEAGKVEQRGEA